MLNIKTEMNRNATLAHSKYNPPTMNTKILQVTLLILTVFLFLGTKNVIAQPKSTYMRIAKITVDSAQLNAYLIALKTQMHAALKHEKGVLGYAAVQDKNHPHHITIMETYASVPAYESHIQTPHFKTYKTAVAHMVKALELTDVIPIGVQSKRR